jgi:hypothetical protein
MFATIAPILVTTFSPQYKHYYFILLVVWITLPLAVLKRVRKLAFSRGVSLPVSEDRHCRT